ncbi:hypothetical protein F0562_005231 [Nyssa sinensis]|uniref:Protein FLX-like 2 n=1 Tax=Nyssa sinensis TaxID=561372 RepID=A0A5J5AL34_9ASTE|nr:hypothetical protein F0562_005231 [Nyssa sinensis]
MEPDSLKHILREGNFCADKLAELGANQRHISGGLPIPLCFETKHPIRSKLATKMGSKGRTPASHLRHPLPGPGMVHPDLFVHGIHPQPGAFPPFDMLPPPEVMEQKLAAQHVELQKLATENQRLAATHGTLRQELAAAQHELQIVHAQIGAKARADAQSLIAERQELISKVQQLTQDLQRVHPDVQQIPALMSELESLRQDYQHCRATYDYEKKLYNDHLESLQVMEKNYITMAREVEKLRGELTNASNIDRRAGGPYGGTTGIQ